LDCNLENFAPANQQLAKSICTRSQTRGIMFSVYLLFDYPLKPHKNGGYNIMLCTSWTPIA
jgi:hypothetical protein